MKVMRFEQLPPHDETLPTSSSIFRGILSACCDKRCWGLPQRLMIEHSGSNYQGNTILGWKTADHLDGVDGHHIDTDMVVALVHHHHHRQGTKDDKIL